MGFLQAKRRRAEKDTICWNVTQCGFVPAPYFLGGLRPSLMVLQPLTGLLYQLLMEYEVWWNDIREGKTEAS